MKESDNNVKLIVLDRLIALKEVPAHERVLQVRMSQIPQVILLRISLSQRTLIFVIVLFHVATLVNVTLIRILHRLHRIWWWTFWEFCRLQTWKWERRPWTSLWIWCLPEILKRYDSYMFFLFLKHLTFFQNAATLVMLSLFNVLVKSSSTTDGACAKKRGCENKQCRGARRYWKISTVVG